MAPTEPSLEEESAALDGYFSDTPLTPKPNYPTLRETFETAVIITNLPKVRKHFIYIFNQSAIDTDIFIFS